MFMEQPSSNLPNFLIIGTVKAGTSSLYRYLKTHPEIYLSPIKEPRYFVFPDMHPHLIGPDGKSLDDVYSFVWRIEDYRRLFEERTGEPAAGEASPQYLYSEKAPGAIRKLIPDAKLIAILRDPADRAFSHFCHARRDGREPLPDFAAALDVEDSRIAAGCWINHYRNQGYYSNQIKRYLATFPREQMLILLYDDMLPDNAAFLARICAFLKVDDTFKFDTTIRYNESSSMPLSPGFNKFLNSSGRAKRLIRAILPADLRLAMFRRLFALNMGPKPVFERSVRQQLVSAFKPDILELEKLIDRDLSAWLRC
jgi:hypothetical protein